MTPLRYKCSVLVVDDEPAVLSVLAHQLVGEFDITTAPSSDAARAVLARRTVDIVVTDLHLGTDSGIRFLEWVYRAAPRTARVLLTGTARLEDAVDAVNRCHVHRLFLKPWRAEDLLAGLKAVARTLLLERSHEQLLDEYRRLNQDLERRVEDRTREQQQTNQQLQMKNQILERMALTDALTGLPNRRAIDLIARKELLRRARTPSPIAVGLIDADRFKDINSAYLLSGGDHVLTWLGHKLQHAIRGSDSIGRVGGEEFMVVAPHTDWDGAVALGERLRAGVADDCTAFNGQTIRVTVSGGFAVADPAAPAGYDDLRQAAAAALAEAKATGRNRCVIRSL